MPFRIGIMPITDGGAPHVDRTAPNPPTQAGPRPMRP